MSDLIEKMAQEICESGRRHGWTTPLDPRHAAPVARAALRVAEEAGWVLVPKEPTQYMRDLSGTPRAADVWRHMLAAAPKP